MTDGPSIGKYSDDLFNEFAKMLENAGRQAGIQMDRSSIRVTVASGIQLAVAVPDKIGGPSGDVLGMIFVGGRLRGNVLKAGAYVVRVVEDGTGRQAALCDLSGTQVAISSIDTRCLPEPVQAYYEGCDGAPIIKKKHICVGFICCSQISGCVGNQVCFAIEPLQG